MALLALSLPAMAEVAEGVDVPRLTHLVQQDCGSCHGLTRKGGLGLPLTAQALEGKPPEVLSVIILDGIPGTAMPPWRPLLSQADADWIAAYLKSPQKQE
jgi:cytochrome c55X